LFYLSAITRKCMRSDFVATWPWVRPTDLHMPNRSLRPIPIRVGCNKVLFKTHKHLRSKVHLRNPTGLSEGETVTSEEVQMPTLNKCTSHAHTAFTFSGVHQNLRIPVAQQPHVEPIARHNLRRIKHMCPKCGAPHWLGDIVWDLPGGSVESPASPSDIGHMCECGNNGTVSLP